MSKVIKLFSGGGDMQATPPGDPPYDGGMEARVATLEEFAQDTRDRLTRIEVAMATKGDVSDIRSEMHKAFTDQTWRIVGAMLTFGTLLTAAVFFIAKNVR
jgi:hypothetical protein